MLLGHDERLEYLDRTETCMRITDKFHTVNPEEPRCNTLLNYVEEVCIM